MGAPVGPAMRIRMVLKQIYDYALEVQLVTGNPAAMVTTSARLENVPESFRRKRLAPICIR